MGLTRKYCPNGCIKGIPKIGGIGAIPKGKAGPGKNLLYRIGGSEPLSAEMQAIQMLSAAVASILPHLSMTGKSRQSPGVDPPPSAGLGRFALSIQAWYTFLQGDYNKRIGIVETAFAIQAQLHSIPNLF